MAAVWDLPIANYAQDVCHRLHCCLCLCYIVSHIRWSSRSFDNAEKFENITLLDCKACKFLTSLDDAASQTVTN